MAVSTLGEKRRGARESLWVMSRTQFSALLKLTLGGPANLNRVYLPASFSVISSIFVSVWVCVCVCVYACPLLFFKEEPMTNILFIIVIFAIQFNLFVVSHCFAWQNHREVKLALLRLFSSSLVRFLKTGVLFHLIALLHHFLTLEHVM